MSDPFPSIRTDQTPVAGCRAWWLDYGRLVRLPLVFSAVADVTMGYLFVHDHLLPIGTYLATVLASACLYCAGMALNDVYDLEQDRRERPERVLPSGRISWHVARRWGFGLLIMGILGGWLAGYLPPVTGALPWRSGVVATLLALAVVLYDGYLKKTVLGPWLMGSCRGLNVLLGMSLAAPPEIEARLLLGFPTDQRWVALAWTIYVAGITSLARTEAVTSSRRRILGALALMASGWGFLAAWPWVTVGTLRTTPHPFTQTFGWPWLLLLLGLPLLRQGMLAVARPSPGWVQRAVRQALLAIFLWDAVVCGAVRTPIWYAVGILTLLVPANLLRRWIEIT